VFDVLPLPAVVFARARLFATQPSRGRKKKIESANVAIICELWRKKDECAKRVAANALAEDKGRKTRKRKMD
jgi:hypothetical protein